MPVTMTAAAMTAVPPHAEQLAERELQPHGEQQEDDADVGPDLDVGGVGDRGDPRDGRAGDESCDDVAQDDGLAQPFEE